MKVHSGHPILSHFCGFTPTVKMPFDVAIASGVCRDGVRKAKMHNHEVKGDQLCGWGHQCAFLLPLLWTPQTTVLLLILPDLFMSSLAPFLQHFMTVSKEALDCPHPFLPLCSLPILDQAEWIWMFLIQSPLPLARKASEVSKQPARILELMPLFAAGTCKWLCTHQHARRGSCVWLDNAPSWHHVSPAIIFNSSASFYHNRRK